MSILLSYTLVSLVLDFSQMCLAVRKHLYMTNIIILNNSYFSIFSIKSIPGDVRAQVLQEPVGASHADQGRKSGMPHPFSDPGGQEESTGTPNLALASKGRIPQGVVVPIYIGIWLVIWPTEGVGHLYLHLQLFLVLYGSMVGLVGKILLLLSYWSYQMGTSVKLWWFPRVTIYLTMITPI